MTSSGRPVAPRSFDQSLPLGVPPNISRSAVVSFSPRRVERVALLSVVTVLLLSTWGPALLRVGGFYLPELVAVPLAVYLWVRRPRLTRSIWRCILSPVGLAGTFWLTVVAALGVLRSGSVVGPYSEWRASLLLLYSFVFMYTRSNQQGAKWSTRLMWVSFAALCLDALLAGLEILAPGFLGQQAPSAEGAAFGVGRVSVPAVNILAVAYLSTRALRIGLLAVTLALGGLLSLGGHRVVLLATAASALFLPTSILALLGSKRMPTGWLRVARAVLVIVLTIGALRSSVQDYLAEAAGIRYRLFTRTMDTVAGIRQGLAGSDNVDYGEETLRAVYAAYVLTSWPSLLLPHGLGSREVQGRLGSEFDVVAARFGLSGAASEAANTHDNAVLYMAYHHGLVVTGLVAVSLGWLLLLRLRRRRTLLGRVHVAVAVLGMILIDLAYPPVPGINIACIYGALLGTLLNRAATRPVTVLARPDTFLGRYRH